MTKLSPNPLREQGGPGPLFAVAHRDDPPPSWEAGEKAHRDGLVKGHEQIILHVLKVFGRLTAKQIAYFAQQMGYEFMTQHMVSRRVKKMWEMDKTILHEEFEGSRETEYWLP